MAGRKFTVFALFYFVFEGNFQVKASPLPPTPWGRGGAHIWRGDLMEGFLRYKFGGVIHGALIFGILWCLRTLGGRYV